MRITYTYQNYPNCPRATEYSKNAESAAAHGGMFIGLLSFTAGAVFLACTFPFFGNYNWGDFLGSLAFVIVMGALNFYYFVARPNNTQCEINIILIEEGSRDFPKSIVEEYCDNLRKENKSANIKAFKKFFPVFLVGLFSAVALIATIKGVYFLCHKKGGLFLFLGGIAVIGILAYILWMLLHTSSAKPTEKVTAGRSITTQTVSNANGSGDIAFCRKCGAKVLPDSVFCAKCGTKVR